MESSSSATTSNKRLKVMQDEDKDASPVLPRLPTLRKMTSSVSTTTSKSNHNVLQDWKTAADAMHERAKSNAPFTQEEVNDVIHSLQNVIPEKEEHTVDWKELATFLQENAHLSHKDWAVTDAKSKELERILMGKGNKDNDLSLTDHPVMRQALERILKDGNWFGAAAAAATNQSNNDNVKPWAVLVTGVNGIRKTTSLYQDWFPALLQEALVVPKDSDDDNNKSIPQEDLPSGSNSFFRQLDHMIATVVNEEFLKLYEFTQASVDEDPSAAVEAYSHYKAAIFARYRTISEWLGALLLRHAQKQSLHCLMETSGRDVAMFTYVDYFFSHSKKLALHFQINDLSHAQASVDRRMTYEMELARKTLAPATQQHANADDLAFCLIAVNAGGPYGSNVLAGVQADSDQVWHTDVVTRSKISSDWYLATIQINAHDGDKAWTAQAVKPDGSLGTLYEFVRKE